MKALYLATILVCLWTTTPSFAARLATTQRVPANPTTALVSCNSTPQSLKQIDNHSLNQIDNDTVKQTNNPTINHTDNHILNHTDQTVNHTDNQILNHTDQTLNHADNQTLNHTNNQTFNQTDSQIDNQTFNQTFNQTHRDDSDQPEHHQRLEDKLKVVDDVLQTLGRQLIDLQTFVEERVRSEGQSGVKVARHVHEGTRNYYSDSHISATAISAHDHADYQKVLGLGEFVAVLNGVEFRTRHNDYLLMMPSNGTGYNAVDDLPYPDVPPEVTSKPTVQEQIVEMREWYKAFKNQDYSVRDYRKYFKANLCYLEGGWTLSSRDELQEPFKSDRHAIDAKSWFDLSEKIRFTSYAGHQDQLENYAYLPTTMYNITEDGIPQIAQWNYRILCHPLAEDLPTGMLQLQDDLSFRMARKLTMDKVKDLRAARFKLNEFKSDRLMYQIPGKDNYGANLTDDAFGLMNYDISQDDQVPINVGFYHRWFKVGYRGAMGNRINHRGFNDENLWVARTTQPEIMPLTVEVCNGNDVCHWETRRVTYAVPLEIAYTGPLNSWNPYDFAHGTPKSAEKKGRNGGFSHTEAFDGTSYRHYYRTPIEFYETNMSLTSPRADAVGMLDRNGTVRRVAASGISIITPEIENVGKVRLRYPIFPVHSEGSTVSKELEALKDMVMKMDRFEHLYEEPPCNHQDDLD